MGAQTIDSIYTHFRASFKETPEFAIQYYRQNAGVLDAVNKFSSVAETRYFTELSWHYVNALFAKDHYNETIDECDRRLQLIDRHIGLFNDRSIRDNWYLGLVFLKAMAAYKLRSYALATTLLRQLLREDPHNDLYHKWLRDARYGRRIRIIHAIWALSAVTLVFVLFFEEFIPSQQVKLALTIGGFLGVVWNLGYEFYAKRNFRRKTS